MQNSAFHILCTHARYRICCRWLAITFPITEWDFLCCSLRNVCFPFCCIRILEYSSDDLTLSYNTYSTAWRLPKIHTNGNSGTSGLRRSFWLCTALWASAGGTCYSIPSASYPSNSGLKNHTPVLTLSCWWVVAASMKKASPTHFRWSGYHLCCTSVTLGPSVLWWVNWVNSAFKHSTLMPINSEYTAHRFLLSVSLPSTAVSCIWMQRGLL